MAQHDYNLANQSGADFRADLNNALSAIATTNSGSTEPSTTYAHQLWVDTSSNVLKIRNGTDSDWITTGISITTSNILTGDLTGNVTGNLTGNVTGNVTGDLTGNADTATTLATARTISLSGDVVGSVSFDGSANVDIDTVVQINSITLGTDTTGDYVESMSGGTGVTVTGGTGEGSTPSIAIGQAVATTDDVTFNTITATDQFIGDIRGAVRFNAKADGALSKGDVVYISGVSGDVATVGQAKADDASKMPAFGFAAEDANDNAAVEVVTFGTLAGLDTSGVSEGQVLYVSTTAGEYTTTKPTGESALLQNIGKVQRSHATEGSIKVGGAGRSNATPNLNDGNIFIGNASNQAVTTTLDTSIVVENTNLYYTTTRANTDFDTRLATKDTGDLTEGSNLYYTTARVNSDFDTRLATKSTTDLAEGTNLYYTSARFDSAFTSKDTDDLSEGTTNLYYTTARFDSAFGNKDTDDLTEGSTNLYYTDTRANSAIDTRVTKAFVDALGIQASSVDANSVTLGTDTVGNYVQTITGTANKITVTGSGSESADVTLTLPDDVQIADSLTVAGNLTVNGTLTSLDTTNLDIEDNLFQLNAGLTGSPVNDSGMLINRGTADNGIFMWDESVDKFTLGLTTADGTSTGNITLNSLGTLVANLEGDVTGTIQTAAQPNITSLGTLTGLTTSGDINLGDNDKAIFGAGSDLQIYHNGFASVIKDSGTGDLYIGSDNNLLITDSALSEVKAKFTSNGSVDLYYDNSAKLATTSTGIDVTGTATMDGLTVDGLAAVTGTVTISSNTDQMLNLNSLDSNAVYAAFQRGGVRKAYFGFSSGGNQIVLANEISDGDIYFIGNDGGVSVTALTLDMSDAGTAIFNHDIKLGDNNKALFGDSSDLQIYHDGSSSYVEDTGSGNLILKTNGSNIQFRDTSDNINFKVGQNQTELYYAALKKLNTTTTGIDVTGTVTADGLNVDAGSTSLVGTLETTADNSSLVYADSSQTLILKNTDASGTARLKFLGTASESGAITFGGGVGATSDTFAVYPRVMSGGKAFNITGGGDISFYDDTGTSQNLKWDASADTLNFVDNAKVIFGAGSDLQIYHDGSNSYIREDGSGSLRIQGADLELSNPSEIKWLKGYNNNRVELFYNNAIKLSTTSSGIDVTGEVTSDGLIVDTSTLVVDSTNNRVGIGNASPSNLLTLRAATGSSHGIKFETAGWNHNVRLGTIGTSGNDFRLIYNYDLANTTVDDSGQGTSYVRAGSGLVRFGTGATNSAPTDKLVIDSSGNVGIGRSGNLRDILTISKSDTTTTFGATTAAIDITNSYASAFNSYSGVNFRVGGATYNESLASVQAQYTAYSGNVMGELVFGTRRASTTDVTEAMRIDSSGNVGIGTTSPSNSLHVASADATVAHFQHTDGINSNIRISDTSDSFYLVSRDGIGSIGGVNSSSNSNLNIDLTSGRVGIGTTSPVTDLDVRNNISMGDGTSVTQLSMTRNSANYIAAINASGYLVFRTGGTDERMRIDSTGNLLVGTTDVNPQTRASGEGVQLSPDFIGVGRYQNPSLYLNRQNNDGDIAVFRKDGSTVGSIGTVAGYLGIANGDTGLLFRAPYDDILPYSSTVNSGIDNTIDLGDPSFRFKDLYLSGGLRGNITFKNNAGTTENARFSSGNLLVGTTNNNNSHKVCINGSLGVITNGNGNRNFQVFTVSNENWNVADTLMRCGKNGTTGRSINAGGTINASGADYAEYMKKADSCGTIAKGDVCGVDSTGKLTDVFADSISFVIKSTNPSYVGGDTWGDVDLGLTEEQTETERQKYDRIAFSGQVPVNITGSFNVGDYVYPQANGTDIECVAKSSPTFEEYQLCVGKIWATEDDGRPLVAVKIG